jgi:hypothetical protein
MRQGVVNLAAVAATALLVLLPPAAILLFVPRSEAAALLMNAYCGLVWMFMVKRFGLDQRDRENPPAP